MTEPRPSTSPDRARPVRRLTPLRRATDRFTRDPSSARNAIILIVIADLAAVFLGALAIWTVDRREYEQFTTALWYILQTVTTVGYGDVTPSEPIGRFIGGAVMLLAIASLSILTASITSAFIDARQAARRDERDAVDQARWAELNRRLDDLVERLDRLDHADRSRGG
jgi:voltage-gated potassium channel